MTLTIHTDENGSATTFRLQGDLSGPSVSEIERHWRLCRHSGQKSVRLDLCEVNTIDEAGKRLLARLFGDGAELVVGPRGPRGHPDESAQSGKR